MSDSVRSPGLRQCCSAAVGLIKGSLRPRQIDQRFIRSVIDAGLPNPGATVAIRALPQVPRSVPTAAMFQGNFSAYPTTIYEPGQGIPYPGNIIPTSQLNPISLKLLKIRGTPASLS